MLNGRSLKAFSSDARSVISGRRGFFFRAFSYAGVCRARSARLTAEIKVSSTCFLQLNGGHTSKHILSLSVQNARTRFKVLAFQELG